MTLHCKPPSLQVLESGLQRRSAHRRVRAPLRGQPHPAQPGSCIEPRGRAAAASRHRCVWPWRQPRAGPVCGLPDQRGHARVHHVGDCRADDAGLLVCLLRPAGKRGACAATRLPACRLNLPRASVHTHYTYIRTSITWRLMMHSRPTRLLLCACRVRLSWQSGTWWLPSASAASSCQPRCARRPRCAC